MCVSCEQMSEYVCISVDNLTKQLAYKVYTGLPTQPGIHQRCVLAHIETPVFGAETVTTPSLCIRPALVQDTLAKATYTSCLSAQLSYLQKAPTSAAPAN